MPRRSGPADHGQPLASLRIASSAGQAVGGQRLVPGGCHLLGLGRHDSSESEGFARSRGPESPEVPVRAGTVGDPPIARISHETWFRSRLFSTRKMIRGSLQRFQYFATVISSLIPFICIAPSPVIAIATRSGDANFAAIAYGTAGPIVARLPESANFIPRAFEGDARASWSQCPRLHSECNYREASAKAP